MEIEKEKRGCRSDTLFFIIFPLFIFYKFTIFIPDVAYPGLALVENDFVAIFVKEFGRGCIAVVAHPGSFDDFAVGKDKGIPFAVDTESQIILFVADFSVAIL